VRGIDQPPEQLDLRERSEELLHRAVVDVEDDPLQLLLGDGQDATPSALARRQAVLRARRTRREERKPVHQMLGPTGPDEGGQLAQELVGRWEDFHHARGVQRRGLSSFPSSERAVRDGYADTSTDPRRRNQRTFAPRAPRSVRSHR
jgi:hypothetical protein